jgi:glycosyltransferase involved in cell wall biosynthesis
MKVAFIGKNLFNSYSGGRIHALTLAYAFAQLGYDVDFYTNYIPVFFKDLPDNDAKYRIRFILNKYFLFKTREIKYQHIVLTPHLASKKSLIFDRFVFYPLARRLKKINNCPLWFIDFESPNWIREVDPLLRHHSAYKYSNTIIKDTDIILSTTKTGSYYALNYYSAFNSNLKFHQLYLAINSSIANKISLRSERVNRVIFFGRFGQKHKNAESLLSIIKSLPKGYELSIIGSKSKIEQVFFEQLNEAAENNKILITFYSNITDEVKFKLLASAKLLLFSSKFEGYGLPPIEAQYVGTPVICSDLPVLRETSPYAIFTNFDNNEQLANSIISALNNQVNAISLKESVSKFCTYENFTLNLNEILKSYALKSNKKT